MATKKSTKTSPEPRAKKAADPGVDYSTGLVDHVAQGNPAPDHDPGSSDET